VAASGSAVRRGALRDVPAWIAHMKRPAAGEPTRRNSLPRLADLAYIQSIE
jgi:hypothetical protein